MSLQEKNLPSHYTAGGRQIHAIIMIHSSMVIAELDLKMVTIHLDLPPGVPITWALYTDGHLVKLIGEHCYCDRDRSTFALIRRRTIFWASNLAVRTPRIVILVSTDHRELRVSLA